jgi:ATP phosphoribosyltransferase
VKRGLTLAIPKGRVLKVLAPLLEAAGIDMKPVLDDDRKLIKETTGGLRFLLLKPDDVPTYVEYGAADLGVSGRDVLLERRYDLYQPLDLGIGKCRMVVAGRVDQVIPPVPRVATKYPRIATEYFASRGVQAEVIFVQGSVELAPLVGLADVIVDIVETGSTLRENGLVERELICPISSVVVANRAQMKLRLAEIDPLIGALRVAVEQRDAAKGA